MNPGPPYKRRRPTLSCTQCRRRKLRCDHETPCGPCSRSSCGLQCVYSNGPRPNGSPSSSSYLSSSAWDYDPTQTANISTDPAIDVDDFTLSMSPGSKSTTFEPSLVNLSVVPSEFPSTGLSDPVVSSDAWNWMFTTDLDPAFTQLRQSTSTYSNEPMQDVFPGRLDSASINNVYGVAVDLEEEQQWLKRFEHCHRLQFLLCSESGHSVGSNTVQADLEPLLPLMMTFESRLSAVRSEQRTITGWSISNKKLPIGSELLPEQQVCDMLVNAYIETFGVVLPVLYLPTFRHEYDRFRESRVPPGDAFLYKLLIVMTIGMSVISHAGKSPGGSILALQDRAIRWIAQSKQWVTSNWPAHGRSSLDFMQIVCLLALVRHTLPWVTRAGGGWCPTDGDLTRIGIQLGLHREPRTQSPRMPTEEAETRRRIWAVMLELSLQLWFDEGLPPALSPESYDCEAPSISEKHTTITTFTSEFTEPAGILALLVKTQRLRLRIIQLVNSPGFTKSFDESYRLATELNAICSSSSERLRSMEPRPSDFQIQLLDAFTKPFIAALHGPFPEKASDTPACYYSRRMRMELAVTLVAPTPCSASRATTRLDLIGNTTAGTAGRSASTSSASSPDPIVCRNSSAYAHLCINGGGHFAVVQREVMTVLSLDLINDLERNTFPILDSAIHQQLRRAVGSCMQLFEQRMRVARGSHSAREYLVASCTHAYVDALLRGYSGSEISSSISEAAKTALEVCFDVWDQRSYAYDEKGVQSRKMGQERPWRQTGHIPRSI